MAFVKIQKTRAYFKRFQVKFKRRREGKTDYYQRKRLISQDKNKYNTKKYRFIVRSTNKYIICQLAYATVAGDIVVSQANSKELVKYGITNGLCNYAAAYATGLLLARRHLHKLNINDKHPGCEAKGEDVTNDDCDPRAFKAVLDIGLSRSARGAKVFGAMKGALDGGINIPHSVNRFMGYDKESKEYKPEIHRDYIYGIHVANYMKLLQETDETAYKRQFSHYIKDGITSDKIEGVYKKAHEAIRADPVQSPKTKEVPQKVKKVEDPRKLKKKAKCIIAKRHNRVEKKKQRILSKIQACA